MVAGVLHRLPLCSHQEDLQPDVDAGLPSSERQWLYWYLRTGDGDIPAVRFPADRDGLGRTLKRAVNAHGDPANFGEAEHPTIQYGAVAILGIGEGVIAVLALEAGIARRFPIGESPEEGVIGL